MHPDEFCPTLFRIGGPALKVWDIIRYSTHDDLVGGGPRSSCDKVIAAGSSLEHAGFDWVDDERAVARKRKRAGSTSGRGKNILFEFEMNLERLIEAMLGLRELCSPNFSRSRDGRRASSSRRSDIKEFRDEVGGLSVALVLIMVDYIILNAVDDLAPLITERAAMIFQNSKLGVNERLDEVNRMIRAEYYRLVPAPPSRSKTQGRSDGRKQPPRAPSPPRGYRPTTRTRSISPSSRSSSWQETSVSSYDDFKGRQSRPRQRRNDGYSVTSSEVSSSTYEDVPELSYESSEDDAYYYYDETESASSDNSDIGTLGARVDDRWNCDPWHKENRRRGSVSQNEQGRIPREHERQHQQQQQRPQTPGRREERGRGERGHTPPPRFSQTRFHDARNIAGDRTLPPRTPVTPRTPHTPGDFSRHAPHPHPPQFAPYTPTPHSRGAPRQAPSNQYPPPPPPRFSSHPPPPPPQHRFSHSYMPMPDGPIDSRPPPPVSPRYPSGQYDLTFAGGKFPSYATPSRNPHPVKMVPGLGGPIPMPMGFIPSNASMKVPAPTPGYVHPRRVNTREYAPEPLPRSSTWPPSTSNAHKRQTFGGFGYV